MSTLDEAMTVHEALADLSGDCREILDRFFAQDQSYKTIGDALDLPSGTIASRISRCLAKLREALEGKNPGAGARLEDMAYDEERIARLLKALPPAPEGWVRAAQELPRSRRELDEIVARAEADAGSARRSSPTSRARSQPRASSRTSGRSSACANDTAS